MVDLINIFLVFFFVGVVNVNGYCSFVLVEVVLGCGIFDIDLGGSLFRVDILFDRIIIFVIELFEGDVFCVEGSFIIEIVEMISSVIGVFFLVY